MLLGWNTCSLGDDRRVNRRRESERGPNLEVGPKAILFGLYF